MQPLNLNEPILEKWLVNSLSIPDNFFFPVDTYADLFFRPLQESKGTSSIFLKEEVDPYRSISGVKWKAYAANPGGIDLLKGEYEVAGLRLAIIEGVNFVIVEVSSWNENLTKIKGERDFLASLIQRLIKLDTADHHWRFPLPPDLDISKGPVLISNQGAPRIEDLQSRHDRVDILLWNNLVYFIFYKKIPQFEDFLPGDKWFSPEARTALKANIKKP